MPGESALLTEDLAAEGEPEKEFHAGIAQRLPRKRVAAGALIRDHSNRILFVTPSYKPTLEIPGGVAEEGESPLCACRREVLEEVGLTLPVSRLLVVDWVPQHGAWPDGVMFIFDGGQLDQDQFEGIKIAEGEILAADFMHLDEAAPLIRPSMVRRLREAIIALKEGHPRYLEFGRSR